jgi:hypothetical protein
MRFFSRTVAAFTTGECYISLNAVSIHEAHLLIDLFVASPVGLDIPRRRLRLVLLSL